MSDLPYLQARQAPGVGQWCMWRSVEQGCSLA